MQSTAGVLRVTPRIDRKGVPATTSTVFRLSFPAAKLSLERATGDVPDDGQFHLVVEGKIVRSFRSPRAAQLAYQALRDAYLAEHPIARTKVDIKEAIRRHLGGLG